ncbi:glycosyltransferase family 4 protein [Dyella halodurans]|uniref:Glycosyltransferase family 4 protein n=1 Tax=Dyella halodurans TaxID=1920171 RepID=A0ABV9C6Z1_9GAMM|nr:glycosyltransferase family 4 protein [Dyella halodurans]
MKLLFVGTNPENTGAATHFVTLAKAMSEAGHAVEGVVSRRGLIGEGFEAAHIPIHYSAFRNVYDVRGYTTVLRRVRAFKPDWLVGNFGKEYWPLIACGRLTHTPVALFRHRTPRMSKLSEYGIPRMAQRFIAVSNYARNAYLAWGVPPELVSISYNPVDTAQFRPDPELRALVRRELGIADDAIVLGYVGRMHGGKGVTTLMRAANEAMAVNDKLHVLWVGNGIEENMLHEMAASSGYAQRHHFTGWVADTERYCNTMSFLAFPSVEPETFGRVAIEAQACAAPVLGSNIGGIPETLQDKVTGFLIEPGNVAAWRDAIISLCDPARRDAMGQAARAFAIEHFGNAAVARDFEALLNRPHHSRPHGHHAHA